MPPPAPLLLRPGQRETPVWSLRTDGSSAILRFRQGEEIDLILHNGLPAPLVLNWHGIDRVPSIEPLIVRRAGFAGQNRSVFGPVTPGRYFSVRRPPPWRRPGAVLARVGPDRRGEQAGRGRPRRGHPDRGLAARRRGASDRSRPRRKDRSPASTVNGKPSLDLALRVNDRLRLRFINACQRNALHWNQNLDVRIMAIDSQPAEPFLARDGRLVLAPGTRVDAFIDATAAAGTTSADHPARRTEAATSRPTACLD